MTTKEKFDAIIERMKSKGDGFTPFHISLMMITSYVNDLHKRGIITEGHTIYSSGKDLIALCEEFDWKPSDKEIIAYLESYVEKSNRPAFFSILTRYRDNREGLLEDINRKKGNKES